jgi:hypothetical protein
MGRQAGGINGADDRLEVNISLPDQAIDQVNIC